MSETEQVSMGVMRSGGEQNLTYVLLTDADSAALREALRKDKSPLSKELRRELKKVLSRA